MRWTHGQKNVDGLLKEYGLLDCKPAATPLVMTDVKDESIDDQRPLMSYKDARRYRRAAATINYLSQDRPDIGVASNFCARAMAQPREGDEARVKRCLRYLKGRPVLSMFFDFQNDPKGFHLYQYRGDVLQGTHLKKEISPAAKHVFVAEPAETISSDTLGS